jgi:NSS family neurotransmitter:Na+ symporter
LFTGTALAVLSMPCVLGFNLLSGVQPFGEGGTIMDLEDFVVSNLLLPLGSLVLVIFCVTKSGWGWRKFRKEANTGKGLKVPNWLQFYMTWILPVIIGLVFIAGLYSFFK